MKLPTMCCLLNASPNCFLCKYTHKTDSAVVGFFLFCAANSLSLSYKVGSAVWYR